MSVALFLSSTERRGLLATSAHVPIFARNNNILSFGCSLGHAEDNQPTTVFGAFSRKKILLVFKLLAQGVNVPESAVVCQVRCADGFSPPKPSWPMYWV